MKTREEELVSSCCNITYIYSINMNTRVLDIIADKYFHKNEGPFVKALNTALDPATSIL